MGDLRVETATACSHCDGTGVVDHEECPTCAGTGDDLSYRPPTADDLVAHLRALPHAERVALDVALLRAEPDAAVEAVDSCKVARPWDGRSVSCRASLSWELAGELRLGENYEIANARLIADGWVLAGGPRG